MNLSNNCLGEHGAVAIAQALQEVAQNSLANPKEIHDIEVLNIASNATGIGGGVAVAEMLKERGCHVAVLNMANNDIGMNGGTALGQAIAFNMYLTNIDLSDNGLGIAGGRAIAEALCTNRSVKVLDMSKNFIGPEGGQAFGAALKVNEALSRLTLDQNDLGDVGVGALSEGLRGSSTGAGFSDIDLNAGGDAGRPNVHITYLSLRHNRIGPAGAQCLVESIKDNYRSTRRAPCIDVVGLGVKKRTFGDNSQLPPTVESIITDGH